MKAVIQRVSKAIVTVDGIQISQIGFGLAILLGIAKGDSSELTNFLAEKIANLRIFEDENGKMNHSLLDTGAEALVVSQFTLLGDCRKGRRPGFDKAALPNDAQMLYNEFIDKLKSLGVEVQTGRFQAEMLFEIHNDGPVTFVLDTDE